MPPPDRDKLADRGHVSLGHYNATRRRLVHAVAGVPHRGMSIPSGELESVGTRQLDRVGQPYGTAAPSGAPTIYRCPDEMPGPGCWDHALRGRWPGRGRMGREPWLPG